MYKLTGVESFANKLNKLNVDYRIAELRMSDSEFLGEF
jgi:hypothetical protein